MVKGWAVCLHHWALDSFKWLKNSQGLILLWPDKSVLEKTLNCMEIEAKSRLRYNLNYDFSWNNCCSVIGVFLEKNKCSMEYSLKLRYYGTDRCGYVNITAY
jgi:hypothetical protein